MTRATSVQPGEVLRGWQAALEPTHEQAAYLRACQRELISAWNLLVISRETHLEHCLRAAETSGVVGPEPERPTPEMLPEVWRAYWAECSERRSTALGWALKQPGLTWADWRHDYKRLREANAPEHGSVASAQMYLSLTQTFQRTKHPRLKKRWQDMPLLNRTGGIAARGIDAPANWDGDGPSRHCEIHFGSAWIRARYWRPPLGPFIEGLALTRDGNRWLASLRCRTTPELLPEPTRDRIGINLGLIYTAATSEGHKWLNPRGNDFLLRVRKLDEALAATTDPFERDTLGARKRALAARYARKAREQIRAEILPALRDYREIVVATGQDGLQHAAQGEQCAIGKRDGGGYVSAMSACLTALKLRYGDRVREVDWGWVSQMCSRCQRPATKPLRGAGIRRKFVCENKRCPEYGVPTDPDVTAARNALRRPAISKEAAE